MRLLLISNAGVPPFRHAVGQIAAFLGDDRRAAFVTAASLNDEATYFESARQRLVGPDGSGPLDELVHLHWDGRWEADLDQTDCVFIGGGNTYALLARLTDSGLLSAIREKVKLGARYIGSSAGGNVAGPNILTTNDWNVIGSTSFTSLGLVPFNLNPHFVERGSCEGPTGESRETRIQEYHSVHANPVVGLEESATILVDGSAATVLGTARACVFERGREPRWVTTGQPLGLATA